MPLPAALATDPAVAVLRRHAWLLVAAGFLLLHLTYLALPSPISFPVDAFEVFNGRSTAELAAGTGQAAARAGDDLHLRVTICNSLPWPLAFTYTRLLQSEPVAGAPTLFVPRVPGSFTAAPGCHATDLVVFGLFAGVPPGRWRLTGVAHVEGVLGRSYHVPWQTESVVITAQPIVTGWAPSTE